MITLQGRYDSRVLIVACVRVAQGMVGIVTAVRADPVSLAFQLSVQRND